MLNLLVTMDDDKYWTVHLVGNVGYLARDKDLAACQDLAACLRAAADKLEADARGKYCVWHEQYFNSKFEMPAGSTTTMCADCRKRHDELFLKVSGK